MKKIHFLTFGLIVSIGAFFASCNPGSGGSSSIKNDIDTVSYLFGYQNSQDVTQVLQQLSLYTDTASLSMSYQGKISAENDPSRKEALEKEFKNKLDSVVSANKKNKAEFLKAVSQVLNMGDDKKAFAAGLLFGAQFKFQMENINEQVFGNDPERRMSKKLFLNGFETGLRGDTSAIGSYQEVLREKMTIFQQEAQARMMKDQQAAQEKLAKENEIKYAQYKAEGEKFLEDFRKQDGVIALSSGVAYKILKKGTGAIPTATDRVTVHYHGTLIDGTVFDSSVERNEPQPMMVGQVIPGWQEILQLMPVGSKWQIAIPAEMAYGGNEAGKVKPFSTLIFEIELLSIDK